MVFMRMDLAARRARTISDAMRTVLIFLLFAAVAVAGLGYVRFAPPRASWHADPMTASDPGRAGVLIRPPEAPVFDMPPEALSEALDRIIGGSARTVRLAGGADDGYVTYVKRTRLMGFPDTTSVRVLPAGDGKSTVAILSRSRFGGYDWGVNSDRVSRWLAAVAP